MYENNSRIEAGFSRSFAADSGDDDDGNAEEGHHGDGEDGDDHDDAEAEDDDSSIRHVLILSQSVLQEPYVYEFIKPHSYPMGSKLLPSQFADKEAAPHCLATVGRGRGTPSLRRLIQGSATCLLVGKSAYGQFTQQPGYKLGFIPSHASFRYPNHKLRYPAYQRGVWPSAPHNQVPVLGTAWDSMHPMWTPSPMLSWSAVPRRELSTQHKSAWGTMCPSMPCTLHRCLDE